VDITTTVTPVRAIGRGIEPIARRTATTQIDVAMRATGTASTEGHITARAHSRASVFRDFRPSRPADT
jgi:hypothetical protein